MIFSHSALGNLSLSAPVQTQLGQSIALKVWGTIKVWGIRGGP